MAKVLAGDIVYWVGRRDKSPYDYMVKHGVVDDATLFEARVDYLDLPDNRRVNGIPIEKFQSQYTFHKLPKNWTYDTVLFHQSEDPRPKEELKKIRIDDPESIKKGLEQGLIVRMKDRTYDKVEADITKEGFRLVRKPESMWFSRPTGATLPLSKLHTSYEGAKSELDAVFAEMKRQSELSDEEWSIEEIDKELDRHCAIYGIAPDVKERMRSYILEHDNVEDIVTRSCMGSFQWKYDRNKKWNTVSTDL